MPRPRKEDRGESINVMIRLSPEEVAEVDALIEAKKFTTRSNAIKTALQQLLRRDLYMRDFHKHIMNDIQDPETERALENVVKKVLSEALFKPK